MEPIFQHPYSLASAYILGAYGPSQITPRLYKLVPVSRFAFSIALIAPDVFYIYLFIVHPPPLTFKSHKDGNNNLLKYFVLAGDSGGAR